MLKRKGPSLLDCTFPVPAKRASRSVDPFHQDKCFSSLRITVAPSRAEIGITSLGIIFSPPRYSRISFSKKRKRSSFHPTKSILFTATITRDTPKRESSRPCLLVCSFNPSCASISRMASSAAAAPVTIFLINSRWPGASIISKDCPLYRKPIRVVSIVMFWACSSRKASRRKAYSKGIPSSREAFSAASNLPSGKEPVSARSLPIRVDFP